MSCNCSNCDGNCNCHEVEETKTNSGIKTTNKHKKITDVIENINEK